MFWKAILAKINNNAYKIELPGDDYGVSSTFNVADLSPFFGDDDPASRTTPFQEGEDDEGIPSSLPSSATTAQATIVEAPNLSTHKTQALGSIKFSLITLCDTARNKFTCSFNNLACALVIGPDGRFGASTLVA